MIENLIVEAAQQGTGVFAGRTVQQSLITDKQGIILGSFDGRTLYPFADRQKIAAHWNTDSPYCLLGETRWVETWLNQKEFAGALVMEKSLMKRTAIINPQIVTLPNDLQLRVPTRKAEQLSVAALRKWFLDEESGKDNCLQSAVKFVAKECEHRQIRGLFNKQEAVGMVSSNFQTSKEVMINMLFIHPNWRRQGLGKGLLEHYMVAMGGERRSMWLFVSVENHKALGLYKKMGFKKQGLPLLMVVR